MITNARLRKSLLAAPLMWGALGCSSTLNWEPLTQFPSKSEELPAQHLTEMARLLERQGRLQSAKQIYSELAQRSPGHPEITQRMELIAAYERKRRDETARSLESVTDGDAAELAATGDSPESAYATITIEQIRRPVATDEPPVPAIRPQQPNPVAVEEIASDEQSHVLYGVPQEAPPIADTPTGDDADAESEIIQVAVAGNEELEQFVQQLNAVRGLVDRLQNPDAQVRRNAAASLAETSPKAQPVLTALTPLLDDPVAEVRIQAAHAVLELDGPCDNVLPVLAASIAIREPAVAGMAAFLTGRIGQPAKEMLPVLRENLLAESPFVAVHVAEAIVTLDPSDREATDVLLLLLESPDADLRWLAACALEATAENGSNRVVQALKTTLCDGSPQVRYNAALSLGAFGETAADAVPQLRMTQFDVDPRVREAAALALARINPETETADAELSQTR